MYEHERQINDNIILINKSKKMRYTYGIIF